MNAVECFNKAEKMSKQSIMNIFTGSQLEDAAEMFIRSGNLYKAELQVENAMKSYNKAVECYVKLQNNNDAASTKALAANMIARTQTELAAEYFCEASKFIIDEGKLSIAARYLQQAAELYDKDGNAEMALRCYKKMIDYCDVENTVIQKKCVLRFAEILAEVEKYDDAINVYERLIQEGMENHILRFSVHEYCYMALLCIACKNDIVGVEKKIVEYCQIDPAFENDTRHKFITEILAAWNENDVDKFTQTTFEFDNLHKLERICVVLLLRIKKFISIDQLL
jgi:alpha-soluble NSF attachment protein